jgi:hypothetical protein
MTAKIKQSFDITINTIKKSGLYRNPYPGHITEILFTDVKRCEINRI